MLVLSKFASVNRIVKSQPRDAVRVFRLDADGDRLACIGNDGRMGKIRKTGAGIGNSGGIDGPGRAPGISGVQRVSLLQVVKVKSRVELTGTTQPLGAKANLIGVANDDFLAVGKGSLEFVVLVFGRSGGNDPQTLVAGIIGVSDDHCFPVRTMGANDTPLVRGRPEGVALEVAILNEFGGVAFDDADIVEKKLSRVQKTNLEFVKKLISYAVFGGDGLVGIGLPAVTVAFIAGGPSACDVVVGIRVNELEAGASAVSGRGPLTRIIVDDLVCDVIIASL